MKSCMNEVNGRRMAGTEARECVYMELVSKGFGPYVATIGSWFAIPAEDGTRHFVVADDQACASLMAEGGGDSSETFRKFRSALSPPTCAACMASLGYMHVCMEKKWREAEMSAKLVDRNRHIDCFLCNDRCIPCK
jgi:hypothetical protein